MAGMDPMRFLESEDEIEILVMQAVMQRVATVRAEANKGR
jgi:hypothetical protein